MMMMKIYLLILYALIRRASNLGVMAAAGAASAELSAETEQHSNNHAATSASSKCQESSIHDGTFGSVNHGIRIQIPLAYQVEFLVGTDWQAVVPKVETSVVQQVVPYAFRECTDADLISDAIYGVQVILHRSQGVACAVRSMVNARGNLCVVVRGNLSVWLDEVAASNSLVRQALSYDLIAILGSHQSRLQHINIRHNSKHEQSAHSHSNDSQGATRFRRHVRQGSGNSSKGAVSVETTGIVSVAAVNVASLPPEDEAQDYASTRTDFLSNLEDEDEVLDVYLVLYGSAVAVFVAAFLMMLLRWQEEPEPRDSTTFRNHHQQRSFSSSSLYLPVLQVQDDRRS